MIIGIIICSINIIAYWKTDFTVVIANILFVIAIIFIITAIIYSNKHNGEKEENTER